MSEEESSDGEEGCSDTEEERYCASTSTRYVEESNHVKLYRAAFILKNIIKDVPVFHTRWPPTAGDFNKKAIIQTVPSELFNFLCWVLGLSDEPSSESLRGSVAESYECKIDSITQDLVYLSSKGQKQTPKSLSLGILVRQLTGSAEVINVLNSFGHCASYDTVIRHETSLANIQSSNQSFVTRDMVKNQPTVFVFDNQDYNEETKSGKGQTHIAAGIAVQRQQSQPDKREPEENISKRKRSLTLKEERLPAHHIGKKKSLDVHHLSEYISTDIAEHSRQQEFSRKLDLAYALCKLQCEDNGDNMPSWTGFNTLLHPDVPAMSTISYLPIIDNPITEWSTINEILCKSVKIADELGLQQVVLVADEAVYAKLQQLRWKSDLYATRCIVRLGEFHAIMSYSSCIGKRFKNSGLEVIYQA